MTSDVMSSEGNIVFVPVVPQLQLFVNDCSKDFLLLGSTFFLKSSKLTLATNYVFEQIGAPEAGLY